MATSNNPSDEAIAEAMRELAHQVDTLGNAVMSAGEMIAKAISGSTGPLQPGEQRSRSYETHG